MLNSEFFWDFEGCGFIAKTAPAARRFNVQPAMQRPEMSCDICDRYEGRSGMNQVVKAERVSARAIAGFIEPPLFKRGLPPPAVAMLVELLWGPYSPGVVAAAIFCSP